MITHIGGSECYNHIILHTHQTQVPPQSCLNGGLPEFWHSETIFSDNAFWILLGGKNMLSLILMMTMTIMMILFAHRVTSPWVPLQLVPLVLYCSPAFEQKYHLYSFHYQDHDHHCHDCIQHHHLLHISPPLSLSLSPTHVLLLPESSPSLAPE